MEPNEPKTGDEALFKALMCYASPTNPKQTNRAALAALRGLLRGDRSDWVRAAPYVVPYLRDEDDGRWPKLVAGLFGLHPAHKEGQTLAQAYRVLRDQSGSMNSRMLALLAAHEDDLADLLRRIVMLLKAHDIPLDYWELLKDLRAWSDSDQVQWRWAREYFRQEPTASAKETASPTSSEA